MKLFLLCLFQVGQGEGAFQPSTVGFQTLNGQAQVLSKTIFTWSAS